MDVPIRKVVFPVGGLGTRFLPATKSMPKEMLPVVDKPLIHYAFEEARDAGIEQFIFITGRNKSPINNHFDHSYELQSILSGANKEKELAITREWLPEPGSLIFIRQQEPLGLGHAVWCARNVIGDEPFAVILADDLVQSQTPCMRQMIHAYQQCRGSNMLGVVDIPRPHTMKYGILDVAEQTDTLIRAKGLVEKPAPVSAPSTIAIIGRYILQPSVFKYLEKTRKGAGGEIQLTDALNAMVRETPTFGFLFEGTRFDCGERVGFIEANLAYAFARPDMRERVKEFLKNYA